MTRFEGRTALVTGGASGIGAATARRIAEEGGSVVVADVQDDAGRSLVDTWSAAGLTARFTHLDVSDEDSWSAAIRDTVASFGGLDILVNNAAIAGKASIEDTSRAEYDRIIAVTQTSVFLGTRAASTALKASGKASVVNVSSIFGIVGGFGINPAYHAAKGAVRVLTKNLALAWGKEGVRVNSVHPGIIDTPMLGDLDKAELISLNPIGRLGQAEEVAAVIAFLASDDAAFVTGSEFIVDGGYTA
ncbi:SDR family NAD(P)-dependent oxidoreductase [Streptomyces uncialis]|uniref:SDR family NAD(P)-dependent oxidoreductase n=1 Tax=Streptomyces uncialis TaxID=1048205 RepID=UPI00379A07C9